MSFIEITVYAAVCDGCGGQAEYDQFCGYSSRGEALDSAIDWFIDSQGRLLCTGCRPCTVCGTPGGYSDSEIFLCDSCWRAPCSGCGHARQLHMTTDHCFNQGCRCDGFPADTRIEAAS